MYNNFGPGEIIFVLIVLGIMIIPVIFFLMTLQKALDRCSFESRTTTPGSVWLLLIPLFNLVWQFIIVTKISESLHNEFTKRNIQEDPQPGKSIGITFCVLAVCSIIPVIGIITSIAAFICWIIYWVKISGYSNKLLQPLTA
jgi:ABC-type Fe3+ transport system permease subunit